MSFLQTIVWFYDNILDGFECCNIFVVPSYLWLLTTTLVILLHKSPALDGRQ